METKVMSPVVINPNHHLWNNHGTWWFHATVLHGGIRQERIRRSLHTPSVVVARRRRDLLLRLLARSKNCQLSVRLLPLRAAAPGTDS